MRGVSRSTSLADLKPFPIITEGMPLIYEDDDEGDMGEASIHTDTVDIALYGMTAHLADQEHLRVFSNLNMHYSEADSEAYASPDLMVAEPIEARADFSSYRIGADGPTPFLVGEVLSERTAQQGDLRDKLPIYALLGIREYLIMDVTGRYLRERLLLKRLRRNRTWKDEKDPDGGLTSRFGFRMILDTDGRLRLLDAATGKRYARPDEAQAAMDTLEAMQEQVRALAEKLARLRATMPKGEPETTKGKGRRRKP